VNMTIGSALLITRNSFSKTLQRGTASLAKVTWLFGSRMISICRGFRPQRKINGKGLLGFLKKNRSILNLTTKKINNYSNQDRDRELAQYIQNRRDRKFALMTFSC